MGQYFEIVARRTTSSRSAGTNRTDTRGSAIRHEFGGTSSPSDSRSRRTRRSYPEREGGEVKQSWKIFLVKLQPKKVSLKTFILYWSGVGIACIGAGLIWGF